MDELRHRGHPAEGAALRTADALRIDDRDRTKPAAPFEHTVQFHDDEPSLVEAVCRQIGPALSSGGAAVLLTSRYRRQAIERCLQARGIDVASVAKLGAYLVLDNADVLSRVLIDGGLDSRKFVSLVTRAIARAGRGRTGVRVWGDLSALLCERGHPEAATRLEQIWNEIGLRRHFSLLCAYPVGALGPTGDDSRLRRICCEHSRILPAGPFGRFQVPLRQAMEVVALQDKAHRLERALQQSDCARHVEQPQRAERANETAPPNSLPMRLDPIDLLADLATCGVTTNDLGRQADRPDAASETRAVSADDAKTIRRFATFVVDVDGLSRISELRGQDCANEVQRIVGIRLGLLRDAHCRVAQSASGEFVAVTTLPDDGDVERFALALMDTLPTQIEFDGATHRFTASIGVSTCPENGEDFASLLNASRAAARAARQISPGSWRRYTAADDEMHRSQTQVLRDLRRALERDELELHYQPRVQFSSGLCIGVEALLRWRSPDGLRGPCELILAAERSGLIARVGVWVVRTAAAQSLIWRRQGHEVPISVNVSALQLQDERFVNTVAGLIEQDPELAKFLEVEVTETSVALVDDLTVSMLQRLRDLGLRIHIDDFGTGYSSLACLARLPIDVLKVDRSFVRGLPDDRTARTIVTGILSLARSLGYETIAEGIETAEQARALAQLGCDQGQGFLFAEPMSATEVAREWFERSAPAPMLAPRRANSSWRTVIPSLHQVWMR